MRHDWNSLLSDPSHAAARAGGPAWPASSTDPSLTLTAATASGWRLFRNYSSEYYPHADALVSYLRDWAAGLPPPPGAAGGSRHPWAPLRVLYNTSVSAVAALPQPPPSAPPAAPPRPPRRFRVSLANGSSLTCAFLVLATGLGEPVPHVGVNVGEAMARGWMRAYRAWGAAGRWSGC